MIESAEREEKLSKRLTIIEIEYTKNKPELERMYTENEKQTLIYQELSSKCEQLKGKTRNFYAVLGIARFLTLGALQRWKLDALQRLGMERGWRSKDQRWDGQGKKTLSERKRCL